MTAELARIRALCDRYAQQDDPGRPYLLPEDGTRFLVALLAILDGHEPVANQVEREGRYTEPESDEAPIPLCDARHPAVDGGSPCVLNSGHAWRHVTARGAWWEEA